MYQFTRVRRETDVGDRNCVVMLFVNNKDSGFDNFYNKRKIWKQR